MNTARGARVFYIPNEHGAGRQFGMRRAFEDLRSARLIDDYAINSLLLKIRNGSDPRAMRAALVDDIRRFKPTILLAQHLGGTGLTASHFRAIRSLGDFRFVYHEADPYSRIIHPLPPEARAAGRHADVVLTVGAGSFRQNFLSSGSKDVRWVPSVFDPGRFGARPAGTALKRDFDIVMVANRNRPRLRGLPNWRDRISFVEQMEDRFGERFAIFGSGWSGSSAKGRIEYSQQGQALSRGWVSANWDHFATEPFYFSDRLPTSLASGSVHATTQHAGFDEIFADRQASLIYADSPRRLADKIEQFLSSTDRAEILEMELKNRAFAFRNFRQDDQLVAMLNIAGAEIPMQGAQYCWTVSSPEETA